MRSKVFVLLPSVGTGMNALPDKAVALLRNISASHLIDCFSSQLVGLSFPSTII